MAEELFSDAWMKQLMEAWNGEPEVKDALAEIGFNSVISCGFKGEDQPRGVFVVENGVCVRAGDYGGEEMDWDMRADKKDWMKWGEKGIGMGMASVRQIVTAHDWRIEIDDSDALGGVRFELHTE